MKGYFSKGLTGLMATYIGTIGAVAPAIATDDILNALSKQNYATEKAAYDKKAEKAKERVYRIVKEAEDRVEKTEAEGIAHLADKKMSGLTTTILDADYKRMNATPTDEWTKKDYKEVIDLFKKYSAFAPHTQGTEVGIALGALIVGLLISGGGDGDSDGPRANPPVGDGQSR